jgi:hypothetical protein
MGEVTESPEAAAPDFLPALRFGFRPPAPPAASPPSAGREHHLEADARPDLDG